MFNRKPAVKEEQSHWRDLALNDRHRKWGWDCPATDIDFIVNFLEYDHRIAVSLIEYKKNTAPFLPSDDANIKALENLANRAGISLFGVRYDEAFIDFITTPCNSLAKRILSTDKVYTELEFVTFLYKLRGRQIPDETKQWILNQHYFDS